MISVLVCCALMPVVGWAVLLPLIAILGWGIVLQAWFVKAPAAQAAVCAETSDHGHAEA